MYHISGDPRTERSARRICDALVACARQKPFDEITVADLHRDYGISRTTFYRLFDNTVDVLEYNCDRLGNEILLNVRGDTPRELTINAITALQDEYEFIEILSKSDHHDIVQRIQEKYLPLSEMAEGMHLDTSCEYFHRILAQLVPIAMDVWVSGGREDTPVQVYEKLRRSVQMLGVWFSD